METTPLSTKVLQACISEHAWSLKQVSDATGIDIATVSRQSKGARPIRDDHLSAYCRCLESGEKSRLVSAWLQDVLDAADAASVLEPGTFVLREEVRSWHPGLTARQRAQLDFWSAKLAADDELDSVFDILSRKAGWQG